MSGGFLQGDGAWGTTGNWSSSAIPIVNDDAIMPNTLTADVTDSGSDAEGIDLDLLQTHPLYAKSFGSTGSPIRTAADLVQHHGQGPFFFECDAGSVALITDRVEIMAANSAVIAEIGSNAADAGDIAAILAGQGNVLLKGNIQFGAAAVVDVLSGASLTLASGADTLATLRQWGGTVLSEGTVTNVYVYGGTYTQDVVHSTNLDVANGGTIYYDDAAESGDGTTVNIFPGGTLDLSREANYKTLTTVNLYPSGILVRNDQLHTFTTLNNYGGTIVELV